MDDAIKKYKQRRDARMKKRLDDDWITIKGTHVMVDDDKQITKGPAKLKALNSKNRAMPANKLPKTPPKNKAVRVSPVEDTPLAPTKDGENYKAIFGNDISDDKVSQSMKDEVSALRSVFGDAEVKSSGPWDDGEYTVGGKAVTVADKGDTKFGDALDKYYDYEDIGDKRVYWDKDDSSALKKYMQGEKAETAKRDRGGGEYEYKKIPYAFSMRGGAKLATPEEKKQRKETIDRFMANAKDGDVYSVGGGFGSGGAKFKVTKSRGQMALQWISEGYSRPVIMSRANVESYIKNGAKKIN